MHKPISTRTSTHRPAGRPWRSSRGSGTPLPVRINEALCASPTSTPRAATASNRRARPQRGPPLNGPPAAELRPPTARVGHTAAGELRDGDEEHPARLNFVPAAAQIMENTAAGILV